MFDNFYFYTKLISTTFNYHSRKDQYDFQNEWLFNMFGLQFHNAHFSKDKDFLSVLTGDQTHNFISVCSQRKLGYRP